VPRPTPLRTALALTLLALLACTRTPRQTARPAAPSSSPAPPTLAPGAEQLLHDFGAPEAWRTREPARDEADALLARFPHPRAQPGSVCDPNLPGTPAQSRLGGRLMPGLSVVRGAFTRPAAQQSAFFIDYCLTGVGQPRTQRLLVLEGDRVEVDYLLPATLLADGVIASADVDLDGRAELLLTTSVFRPETSQLQTATLLQVAPGPPRVLGTWDAIDHCSVRKDPDQETVHRLGFSVSVGGGTPTFTDQPTTRPCYYPPAAPSPPG